MTSQEFNEKYKNYLEDGHYGLDFDVPKFVEYLDEKFKTFITYKDFKYSQIKSKFQMGRFYCTGIPDEMVYEVEQEITKYCREKK